MTVEEVYLKQPADIVEVWDNLDVFPRNLIREVASIREYLQDIDDMLKNVSPSTELKFGAGKFITTLDEVVRDVNRIATHVLPYTSALRPNLSCLRLFFGKVIED